MTRVLKLQHVLGGLVLLAGFAFAGEVRAQASGLSQLDAFVARIGHASGRFEQTVIPHSGRRAQMSSGSFAFSRPGKFRWVYELPYPQVLVSDGEKLWIWDEDLNQVTVRVLGDALGSTPAAILTGDGSLNDDFELSEGERVEGLAWVDAKPRQQESAFQSVRLGFTNDVLQKMEMRDNFGQRTMIVFSEFDINTNVDQAAFRFSPPPGADVIGGD